MLEGQLHEKYLLRYSVLIQDIPIRGSLQTAVISFFDEDNKKVCILKYGVVRPEEIYALIDKGEKINLRYAYVKDFSLSDYRTSKGLDDHVIVKLKDFTAKKTFFDCEICTDFSYGEFEGAKSLFDSSVFGNGNINFSNCSFRDGEASFKRVKFGSGSTTFKSVKFGTGLVSFNNTNFGTGNLNFVDVDFGNGDVDFKNTWFGDGMIDFKFSRFAKGDISFEHASFGRGKKDFKNVEFGGGRIDFKRINFNDGDVSFDGVEFGDGKVSFRNSEFGKGHKSFEQADFAQGEAMFDQTDFGSGSVSFKNCRVDHISFRGCPLNCYFDLRLAQCQLADLSNTIIRDIVDVIPENEKVVIQALKLTDVRILGRIFIDWRSNQVFGLIYNQKDTSLFQKGEQFRILKENFRNNGQYEDEDAAYLEFKRCEAKANLQASLAAGKKNAFIAYPVYYFQKYVFDYIGRYATAPTRVLANVFVTVILFSLIYYGATEWFPSFGMVATTLPNELSHVHAFSNDIYYSFITFFTIGYGDYFPDGFLKAVASFEGFTGVFLMSYFTVAFVRKILR